MSRLAFAHVRVRLLCVVTLAWPAARLQAEPPPAASDYNAIIKEAVAEFEDGNAAEARALFLRAHELQPSARTLRGLGISAFELREYEDSIAKLEQSLYSTVKPLEGAMRLETEQLLHRAYGFVGRYRLALSPPSAVVSVDGVETALRQGSRLMLAIGRYSMEARAPGHETDRRALDVSGGENTGLSFTLRALPDQTTSPRAVARASEPAGPTFTVQEKSTPRPLYRNPWLWAGVGTAVAVVVVAIGVSASRDRSELGEPITTTRTLPDGVIEVP
jgi:hypothetical protein